MMKPLEFLGSSLDDLRTFAPNARYGAGVYEIRGRDEAGAFRVMYVAKFEQAVYVLHAFQKKTQKTTRTDIELAARRYRELLQEIRR